jgi:NADH:ubiquinone oxidoreductase subunit 5 (subunit L)/multisubunit Na+/H+ antiporter MnhA subunit
VIGFSGYYSKDAILEQAFVVHELNPLARFLGLLFFYAAAGGAAITAFYMFRMWYMTFAGKPRDQHRYDHAHESPPVMYVPLVVLAVFAIGVAWQPLERAGPAERFERRQSAGAVAADGHAGNRRPAHRLRDVWPNEHFAHEPAQFTSVDSGR